MGDVAQPIGRRPCSVEPAAAEAVDHVLTVGPRLHRAAPWRTTSRSSVVRTTAIGPSDRRRRRSRAAPPGRRASDRAGRRATAARPRRRSASSQPRDRAIDLAQSGGEPVRVGGRRGGLRRRSSVRCQIWSRTAQPSAGVGTSQCSAGSGAPRRRVRAARRRDRRAARRMHRPCGQSAAPATAMRASA